MSLFNLRVDYLEGYNTARFHARPTTLTFRQSIRGQITGVQALPVDYPVTPENIWYMVEELFESYLPPATATLEQHISIMKAMQHVAQYEHGLYFSEIHEYFKDQYEANFLTEPILDQTPIVAARLATEEPDKATVQILKQLELADQTHAERFEARMESTSEPPLKKQLVK